MKQRQWKIKRQVIERPDAERRWGQAYQYLMLWTSCPPQSLLTEPLQTREEKADESSSLCSGVYAATDPNTNH